jgi:hypothetical protein
VNWSLLALFGVVLAAIAASNLWLKGRAEVADENDDDRYDSSTQVNDGD